jgi:hypothetical protein
MTKSSKSNIAEITVTLVNGETVSFQPKDRAIIKIMRGVSETQCDNFVERNLNGKEAFIVVSAPDEIIDLFDDNNEVMSVVKQILNR